MISLTFIGFTLDVLGKLLIAWVTLRLHVKHFKKHRIDKEDLSLDVWLSTLGIVMILLGYALRIPYELSI
jgi:hypothetical protein